MGAEALCRGADDVIGIEKSSKACAIIRQNWNSVASSGQSFRLIRGDVVQQIPTLQGQSFDLIYFDPPYASDLYLPVLRAIATYQLLTEAGEIAVEHDATQDLPDIITPATPLIAPLAADPELTASSHPFPSCVPSSEAPLVCCREKKYGSTLLTFYTT
jgi:16S rRNA (guanine(966)-N(2))-methyltransferase RsmD